MTNAVGATNSVAEFNWVTAKKNTEATGSVAQAKQGTDVTGSIAKVEKADEGKKVFDFNNKPQQTIADGINNGGFSGGMDIAA